MKYFVLLILLGGYSGFLNAQIQSQSSAHQIRATYQLDFTEDRLTVSAMNYIPSANNDLKALNSYLENNELIIKYRLGQKESKGYYLVSVEVNFDDKPLVQTPGYIFGDLGSVSDKEPKKQITWTNFLADVPNTKGKIEITLTASWVWTGSLPYGVDCEKPPKFGFKQQIPFYAGLLAGSGSIVGGIVLKNRAEDHLELHRSAITLSEQKAEYDEYTNILQDAKRLTYAGVGIITLDALFYVLRMRKHKKQVDIYQRYCNSQTWNIYPLIEFQNATNLTNLNLHIVYQF